MPEGIISGLRSYLEFINNSMLKILQFMFSYFYLINKLFSSSQLYAYSALDFYLMFQVLQDN